MRGKIIPPELLEQILSDRIKQAYWSRVDKHGPNECWPWKGCTNQGGYGRFSFNFLEKENEFIASRLALIYEYNRDIEPGKFALHSCIENRKCCNPNHLRAGTQLENIHEMIQQGRKVVARGERNRHAKLTTEKVIEIRRLYALGNLSHYDLGPMFGVDRATISRVVNRKVWTHI